MAEILLLTGAPGVGKTTLIETVLGRLSSETGDASGFVTREVRDEEGKRRGFRYRTLEGKEGWLARRGRDSLYRLGSYGVDLEGLERDAVPAIDPAVTPATLLVIDEIGKMESFSRAFRQAVDRALASDRIVLATISRSAGGWIGAIRERDDAWLAQVTEVNRDSLQHQLLARIRDGVDGVRHQSSL